MPHGLILRSNLQVRRRRVSDASDVEEEPVSSLARSVRPMSPLRQQVGQGGDGVGIVAGDGDCRRGGIGVVGDMPAGADPARGGVRGGGVVADRENRAGVGAEVSACGVCG